MAQTVAEYEAALAAITDGAKYRICTEVDGTKYYVTAGGTLTNVKTKGDAFAFKKITETSGDGPFVVEETTPAVGIQMTSSAGTRFTNGPLSSDKAVLDVLNFSTSTNNRAAWESQVFFLKSGKFAIRTCNTIYAESSWKDAGRTFWTYKVGDAVTPQYSYDPAYVWELESYSETPEQQAALAKLQAWPAYVQGAVGLVKDASKYTSNAVQTTEGSIADLLDGNYNSYFHSCWSNGPDEDHYLQAELSEATQKFEFYYKKRADNNNNRPTKIIISAGNSADGEFTEVTTINSGLPTDASVLDYMSSQIDLGAAYKFVRFTITETNNNAEHNGHKFFTFSEFYMFPGVDAAAQLAPLYNQYTAALAGDLTATDVAQINAIDVALKSAIATVTVTYELYEADGTTKVGSKEVVQKPYSAVEIPADFKTNAAFYNYTTEGTIGDTDCTIKVTRAYKPELVLSLDELSNNKAYTIACARGAFLTKDGYLASTKHSSLAQAAPGQFAIISYKGHYYLYSVADGKFVKNDGALAEMPTGLEDAIVMDPLTVPYFLYHFNKADAVINTNGNNPYGYVINNWSNADDGNQYYMIEAADFDATNALKALDELFKYSVVYKVKDAFGNTIFTSDVEPVAEGFVVATLPEKYRRAFYTYDEVNVSVETVGETEVAFNATWGGPFEISENFANAHWYDMAMRTKWYVTTDKADADGAYLTQLANTMGLVEESYHWAFLGDGYNGFKVINKAEGEGKSFAYGDNLGSGSIPTIMDDNEGHHVWKIVASTNTSVPANSFCLGVPGTDLYINQYNGAGGPLKFWNSANNIGDPGSAFTVFDVPTNFASFVVDEIAPAFDATGYFTFTDEAKAALGWDPAYKTECPFATYKALKESLEAVDLTNLTQFVLPETGYYLLKNKNYGTYMGIDPSDANMYGNYDEIKGAKNIVKLTKTGEATYSIGLMGKFAPATVAQSAQVTATADAANYTVVVPAVGYAAFQADTENNMSVLHCAGGGSIVGWEAAAAASQWEVVEAEGTEISITVGEAGYATAYMPFPVKIADGVTAYTAEFTDSPKNNGSKFLTLNEVPATTEPATIPELTAVILKAAPETYKFTIGEGMPAGALGVYDDEVDGSNALAKAFVEPIAGNVLKGTLEPIDAVGKYVLAKPDDEDVAFYEAKSGTIAAGKAYIENPYSDSDVKAFYFLFPGEDPTGISTIDNAQLNVDGVIYNIAGQRVSKIQKGINIVNGKKFLR